MTPPAPAALVDAFGRRVRDLRLSVTDRCSFRCRYCMPAEGMAWLPREELLTFEEIERVARIAIERFDVTGIRVTGGEPTVRAQLPVLVARLARLGADLSMTTNGASLALVAHDLAAAGLQRVNVSIDSLRREVFARLTGRDALPQVLEGIDAAVAAGLAPVKLNVVLVRGENDGEALDLATFGRDRGVIVRFIELMPLDAQGAWRADQVVPAAETRSLIDDVFPLEALPHGPEPASRFRYRDGAGEVGFIASVTEPFCGDCDRIRLTADGQVRTCLFSLSETDLRLPLRSGVSDDAIAALLLDAVGRKWAGHAIGQPVFIQPSRGMSQIGG